MINGFTSTFAGITTTDSYNNRLQPITLSAGTTGSGSQTILSRSYYFHLNSSDNGVVYQIVNGLDSNRTQNFTYDNLNRITQANTTGPSWGETYTVDAWGNLTGRGPVSGKTNYEPLNAAVDTNNRVIGLGYDGAGNLTGSATYVYDDENRLTNLSGYTYSYDATGQRVTKMGGANPPGVVYLHGAGSETLAETQGNGTLLSEYIYLNGQRIARRDALSGAVHYYFADHLGSASVITDASGNAQKEADYYPYGGEIVISGSDANHYKFTGKERDAESGLDYFGARYFGSTMGRFMSPDPLGGHLEYPQSLNKYVYVMNNPMRYTDPTGMDIWLKGCGDNNATCKDNYVGSTDKDGNFTRTHLTGDQTNDATLGAHGISVTQGDKTYEGVWDTNKGEDGTVTVTGSGALKGYSADVTGNCGGNCVADGVVKSPGNNGSADITQALFKVLDTNSSGYVKEAGTDGINFFHPGATNFRGHQDGDPTGIPSTHIPIDPRASTPRVGFHIDRTFPYDSVGDWLDHAGCASSTICNPQK